MPGSDERGEPDRARERDDVLTMNEMLALLRISRATFYRCKRAGEFHVGKKIGGRWRFLRSEVEQMLRAA